MAGVKKEKGVQSLRSGLNEESSNLNVKHTAEVDLLEDFRLFTKQRSTIEKEYGQALQKLSQQFLTKRNFGVPPEIDGLDRSENRGLLELFKYILEHTEFIGNQRMQFSDSLLTQISEVCKTKKKNKEQSFRKHQEVQQQMHAEVLSSVRETTKNKKAYHDLERLSSEARQRFGEAEAKAKKKELKFYESRGTLERHYQKIRDKLKSCQKRSTVARNEYLLSLGSSNALLEYYFQDGLPALMKEMDGDLYDSTKELYELYCDLELQACSAVVTKFRELKHESLLVSREYVIQCFLRRFPVLTRINMYTFEPYGQDKICAISKDHGAEIYLTKDARKVATQLKEQQELIIEKSKAVKGLQSVSLAYTKNPEFGTTNATQEAEAKIDLFQEELRHAEMMVLMIQKRMDILRKANIDVDKWMQPNKENIAAVDRQSIRESTIYDSDSINEPELLDVNKEDRSDQLSVMSMMSTTSSASPKFCIVLYGYKARASDELDIVAGEELEITEWDDGDGWCKGRNKPGNEGYFPQSYVTPVENSRPSSPRYTRSTTDGGCYLRALFEYTAVSEEELSFPEGSEILLLRKDDNGIDDGWWEGEYMGQRGVFPSIVVEVIGSEVDNEDELIIPEVCDSPPPLPPDTPNSPPPNFDFDNIDKDNTITYQNGSQPPWKSGYHSDSFDEENSFEASIV